MRYYPGRRNARGKNHMQRSTAFVTTLLAAALAGHAGSSLAADAAPPAKPAYDAKAGASTRAGADSGAPDWASKELPHRKIPNVPENGEAYYAPDGVHLIAQVKDPPHRSPARAMWVAP